VGKVKHDFLLHVSHVHVNRPKRVAASTSHNESVTMGHPRQRCVGGLTKIEESAHKRVRGTVKQVFAHRERGTPACNVSRLAMSQRSSEADDRA
jgi:hypothetical protein